MLISCEKCSTTYVLDDALIPPQGTPVQCTRCGHVFTAKPGAGDAPAPVAAAPPPDKGVNSTLMFGAVGAGGPAPKANSPNQTMVFGAPSAGAAPSQRSSSPANQTMVFGTAAATQAQPEPAAKPNLASQTMVFGTNPSAARPPPPAASKPSASQTMVFGTQQATSQPPPAAPPKKGSETMVFGKGAATAAPPPSFGTPVATQSRPSTPAATPSANQTLVFGASQLEDSAPKNQTMMFGRPAAGKPAIPKVTAGSVELAGYAADEGPAESTVRVDLENVMEGGAAAGEDDGPSRHDRTQRYAMTDDAEAAQPLIAPESVEERHNRTALFAMNPMAERTHPHASAPLALQAAPPGDDNATLMFGNNAEPQVASVVLDDGHLTPPQAPAAPLVPTVPHLSQFDSSQNLGTDQFQQQPEDAFAQQHEPSLGAVDLPPEPAFTGDASLAVDQAAADDAAVAQMRDSRNRRLTIFVVVLLLLVVALAGALFWFTFGRAMVNKESAHLLQQTRDAVSSLRADDETSRLEAIATLRRLMVSSPKSPEVHSALVLALALSCDDVNEGVTRLTDTLKRARAQREGSKDHAALDERVQKLNARLSQAQSALNDRRSELAQAQQGLEQVATGELTDEQRFVVVRSRAIGAAVLGGDDAIALAEEARQKSVTPDNWADLALPEYVINGGSSFDDALKQLEVVQQRDSTFLRAYVLAARIKVKQNELDGADEQLTRVLTLQPRHEVAGQLHEWIASRQRQAD